MQLQYIHRTIWGFNAIDGILLDTIIIFNSNGNQFRFVYNLNIFKSHLTVNKSYDAPHYLVYIVGVFLQFVSHISFKTSYNTYKNIENFIWLFISVTLR